MKTMKKQTIFFTAALLTAGTLLTSCSNDDMTIEKPTEQTAQGVLNFTTTIAPKGGTATTRSVDADGVTAWGENEQIAVYYQKTDNSYTTATATVGTPNPDGSAPITATLSDAKGGTEVKFVYPASIVNATGDDLDATKLAAQHGTIAGISANFDAATGSSTLVTDGATCGTDGTVTMTNQVLIGKFIPKFGDSAIDGITTLTVTDGTRTYTVTPVSGTFGTDGIYVAMLPVADQEIIITAATAAQSYGYGGKKITLAVGKLYDNLSIKMGKLVNLTGRTSDYTAEDGDFVTGSLTNHNVIIPDGYKVTLSNLTLNRSDNDTGPMICKGGNTITLSGTNSVRHTGGTWGYPAIYAGATDKTLTIKGCGRLTATTTGGAAAIGAGCFSGSCGNIRIEGGEITVQSATYGAGIGAAGNDGTISCGDITITGGHVVASISKESGTGIGCYSYTNQATCGNITISGGMVEATGGTNGAGIGSGTSSNDATKCGSITISGGMVEATGGTNAAGIGGGNWGASCDDITISGGTVTANGGAQGGAGIGNYNKGTCGNISISGTANVTATGKDGGAGIGNGKSYSSNNHTICGNITISGSANVTATGYYGAAGIGSGYKSGNTDSNICGTITISGGTVVATAEGTIDATPAAGIGTGYGGTCGSISVTGGTVTATKSPSSPSYIDYSDIGVGMTGSIKDGEADGTITVASTVKTNTGKGYVVNNTYGYNQEQ